MKTCGLFILLSLILGNTVVAAEPAKTLQLQELVAHALQKSYGIQIADLEAQLGKLDVRAKRGMYDTITTAVANYTLDRQESPIPIFGTENKTTNFDLGIQKALPSGTVVDLSWRNQRLSTNSTFSTINPVYVSHLQATLTQPILQNFFGRNSRMTIESAEMQADVLTLQIEDQIETLVSRIIESYWSLAYQQQLIIYVEEAVRWAETLLASNRKKQNLGLMERSDVLAAEANLSLRRKTLVSAKAALRQAQLNLAQLANLDAEANYEANMPLTPQVQTTDSKQIAAAALTTRRDLQILKKQLQQSDLVISMNKNSLLPSLDLTGSLSLNGLDSEFSPAQEEFFTTNNVTWFAGGVLTYNWENDAQRAALAKQKIVKRQQLLQYDQTLAQVNYDIQHAVIDNATAVAQLEQAQEITRLQQAKLKEEERRVSQGRSDTTRIVQNQDDLLLAQQDYLLNALSYQLSLDALLRVQNSLLKNYR